jgi:FkbM family methyltransferase
VRAWNGDSEVCKRIDELLYGALADKPTGLRVLCTAIDSLALPQAIHLVKIDAEGHELAVLRGMANILEKDQPILIVEDNSVDVEPYLANGLLIAKVGRFEQPDVLLF